MRFIRGIFAFGLFVFLASAAQAASQRDLDDCVNQSGDIAIAACTRFIQDRSESAIRRAVAYASRGVEYRAKRDLDRAFADFNEAARLDPKLPQAYNGRGAVYEAKGETDRAIADYTQAIRIDPKYGNAYYNRGLAYRDKADRERAIADFRKASGFGQPDARAELRKLGVTP